MLHAAVLIVGLSLGQQTVDPKPEVTERKTEALSASLQQLERVQNLLKRLGNPAERQPGENNEAYFNRLKRYYKARAYLVIGLQKEYRTALENQYALQAELKNFDDYLAMAADKETEFATAVANYRTKKKDEENEKMFEARALAILLAEALAIEAEELEKTSSPDAEPVRALRGRIERLEGFAKKLYFTNFQSYTTRFEDLTTREELEAALQKRFEDIKLARWEQNYVDQEFGGMFARVERVIDEALRDAVEEARDIVADPRVRDLEYRARQVAVISKHLQTQLEVIADAEDFDSVVAFRLRLESALEDQKQLNSMLDRIFGAEEFDTDADGWAQLFADDVPEDSPPAETEANSEAATTPPRNSP